MILLLGCRNKHMYQHFSAVTKFIKKTNRRKMSDLGKTLKIVSLSYSSNFDEVLRMLIGTYKQDWPLIHLLPEVPHDVDLLLTRRIEYYLKNGPEISFGVRDISSGKLIAALVSCISRKETFVKESEEGYSEGIQHIIRMHRQVEGDLFSDLKTDAVAKMGVGAVEKKYAHAGIMKNVIMEFFKAAITQGIEYSVSFTTSEYGYRMRQQGVDITLREMEYAKYCDAETGVKPFTRAFPPHTHVRELYRRNLQH